MYPVGGFVMDHVLRLLPFILARIFRIGLEINAVPRPCDRPRFEVAPVGESPHYEQCS